MAGRPREFDEGKALRQAKDLFWERGYEGVSMSDLTQELGLASARIYAAFGSKEELFRKAILLYEEGEGGFADEALNSTLPLWDSIEQMFARAIDLYTQKHKRKSLGCMVVSSAVNCTEENDAIRKWLQDHRRQRTHSIIRRFERAVEQGEIEGATDAPAIGDLCASMLHGISVQARDGVSRSRLRAMVRMQISALKSALTTPKARVVDE